MQLEILIKCLHAKYFDNKRAHCFDVLEFYKTKIDKIKRKGNMQSMIKRWRRKKHIMDHVGF